jgi:protein TonB
VDHRQGFLVSAVVHLTLLTLLVSWVPEPSEVVADEGETVRTSRVFLPPPEVLNEMASPQAPAPPPPAPPAAPPPSPPAAPTAGKDRISIGAPSNLRQQGPLELRRDDDLTKVARGRPDAVPTPEATPVPVPESVRRAQGGASEERPGAPGLRLPGAGALPGGAEGSRGQDEEGALSAAVRQLDRRGPSGELGIPEGTGRQMGALLFDPRGADFTRWVNHFKNEVYRNWLVPQGALLGFGGEVKIEFTVLRDGTMTGVRMIASSGTPALDRAARGALLGSLLLPLPDDFAPQSVTMVVTFQYARG